MPARPKPINSIGVLPHLYKPSNTTNPHHSDYIKRNHEHLANSTLPSPVYQEFLLYQNKNREYHTLTTKTYIPTERNKKGEAIASPLSCGGPIRTNDLWVMSPTSYHCSTPRCFFVYVCKGTAFFYICKLFGKYFCSFIINRLQKDQITTILMLFKILLYMNVCRKQRKNLILHIYIHYCAINLYGSIEN